MAAAYVALAFALGVTGYVLRPWGLLLVWPAAAFATIAAAYLWFGPHVFRKRDGRLHPISRLGLLPYELGSILTFPHYRRTAPPWVDVTPHLVLGRRLTDDEARQQIDRGVRAVLDLTAECTAPPAFRSLAYRNVPILDLTVPTPRQFADGVEFIRAHAKDGAKVYLHCKLGRSRSAAVAAAYLIAEGLASSGEEAVEMVRRARPEIVIKGAAVEALDRYAEVVRSNLSGPPSLSS